MLTRNTGPIPDRTESARWLDELRLSVDAGVAALDRGDYSEVDDQSLDAYLDDLAAPTPMVLGQKTYRPGPNR